MFDRFNEIHDGMDVCDRDGDKIGSVKHVYTSPASGTMATAGTMSGTMPAGGAAMGGVFQVDTGFLGLGTDYYIPFSAVTGIANNCARLDVDKDNLNQTGWDHKPAWLQNS